jgi:hypothetical protein
VRSRLLAALFLASLPQATSAQQVRGVIRDSATAFEIAGAVASVFDAAGNPLARTIADERGRYRLSVPASAVRLQILRIGYRPREVQLPQLRADTVVTIDVAMGPVPKFLSAVHVSDRAVCPEREAGGQALALWEQARSGLLAMVVARTARPAQVRQLSYERSIDVRTGRITTQTVRRGSGVSSRPFVASRPAAEFARYGYMLEDPGGRTYFAPDADVLLDPSFMTAHCFRLQIDEGQHPGEIGLAFAPAPGRDTLVDVAGALWLDRNALALHTLEYRYTGLEPAALAARVGGTLLFRVMPNGVVFVERWSIVMPVFRPTVSPLTNASPYELGRERRESRERRAAAVARLTETGGELVAAAWADAEWKATLGRVSGRVLERGTGRPVVNVAAWLDGTSDTVRTDATGAFTFDELLPGPYTLRAADTTLAEFGIAQSKSLAVDVPRAPLTLSLEWQTIEDIARDLCRGERGPLGAAILGRTTNADRTPASDVTLSAGWQSDFEILPGEALSFRRVSRTDRSNEKGVFHLCNVPREQRIGVRATFAPRVVKDTVTALARDEMIGILRITRP